MNFFGSLSQDTRQIFNLICWGISFFSFVGCLLSFCILKLPIIRNSIINQLISFLMLAEIINNANQLSGVIQYFSKNLKSNYYFEYMRICYVQIFFNNFSNYLNLSSSTIIAIYSFNALTNAIPHSKWIKYLPFVKSTIILIPSIISYILWMTQMQKYQSLENVFYFYKRANTCSVNFMADIIGITLYWIIIICLVIFCIKTWKKLNYFKNTLIEEIEGKEELQKSHQSAIDKMQFIQRRMCLFPIVSFIIFISFTMHRIYYVNKQYNETYLESKENSLFDYLSFWIPSSLRGLIFTVIYFLLQPDCFRALKNLLCCKTEKLFSEADIIKDIEGVDELESKNSTITDLQESDDEIED